METQIITDIHTKVAKALGIVDVMRNCAPEQLNSDSLANVGDALFDILQGIDTDVGEMEVQMARAS